MMRRVIAGLTLTLTLSLFQIPAQAERLMQPVKIEEIRNFSLDMDQEPPLDFIQKAFDGVGAFFAPPSQLQTIEAKAITPKAAITCPVPDAEPLEQVRLLLTCYQAQHPGKTEPDYEQAMAFVKNELDAYRRLSTVNGVTHVAQH